LEAPFDWIIRTIDYMVWDNLRNDTDKYIYIENPNLVEIVVRLDQLDVVNVWVWSEATIVFDAYQDISAKAKVTLVDRTPITNDWVVFYEVKLVIDDESFDETIFSGMTASVYLITKQKENVLILKSEAIKNDWNKKVVLVERNGIKSEVEIKTGIIWEENTEIIFGLEEWNKIIYKYEEFVAPVENTLEQKMNEQKELEDSFRESTGYGN
jgi:multidrug efflux pump subunit AcrA (membrane-fusion protein)